MKSTEFITEAEVKPYSSELLATPAAAAFLNQHCKNALAMLGNPLWRGMRNHSDPIIVIDPRSGKRKSENTTNYYTQIIDNSPYFKGWPKRSKSLICSSGIDYAAGYSRSGGLYAIFPYDGVPIAVCPEEDMWSTPAAMPGLGLDLDGDENMNDLNRFLRYDLGLPESYPAMKKSIQTHKFAANLTLARAELTAQQRKDKVTPENFLEYLQYNLSPQKCGFRLLTIEQFAAQPPNNKECWVGGPVVAIRADVLQEFVKAVSATPGAGWVSPASKKRKTAKPVKKQPTKVSDSPDMSDVPDPVYGEF